MSAFRHRTPRMEPTEAEDLIDLLEMYAEDDRFKYPRDGSVRLVAGDGASRPKLLVVGDAPGAVDSTRQKPFTGRDGQILRSLLKDVGGFSKEDWWGTYLIKHRIEGKPYLVEAIAAREYVQAEHLLLGKPPVIVAVGSLAWQSLGTPGMGGLLSWAGKPMAGPWGSTLCAMLHPRYGLRHPEMQDKIESHWEHLAQWMKEVGL